MFFENIRFPVDIGDFAKGGKGYKTNINEQDNGYEYRNQNWSDNKGVWTISNVRLLNAYGTLGWYDLANLHRIARGRLHGFRFQAPLDYSATADEGVLYNGFGNGKPILQLGRRTVVDDQMVFQDIKKPVEGTLTIYKNNIALTNGFSVDYSTGLVTFNSTLTSVGSIAVGNGTSIVTTSSAHNLQTGKVVYLTSTNPLVDKKTFTITVLSPTTFSIPLTNGTAASVTAFLFPQPTDVLTAEFEFDYPVRFDNDEPFDAGLEEDGLVHLGNVTLVELRT